MHIEFWYDLLCPFCYIAKRRLEKALATVPLTEPPEIFWRSFEIDPVNPGDPEQSLAEVLSLRHPEDEQLFDRIETMATDVGLFLSLSRAKRRDAFNAHRLVYLAAESGQQGEAVEALMNAALCQGAALDDNDSLREIMASIGLPKERVDFVLGSEEFQHDVRADEFEVRGMGVTGVPFLLIDKRFALTGVLPEQLYVEVLSKSLNHG